MPVGVDGVVGEGAPNLERRSLFGLWIEGDEGFEFANLVEIG